MPSISYALRNNLRPAIVQAGTLLLCFGSGLLLDSLQHLGPTIVVLTTVLGMTLGRTQRNRGLRNRLFALVTLPLISIGCNEVARLFVQHPNVADTLFTAAIGLSIWMRRFGGLPTRLGTLIALPFIALLITPVPVLPGQSSSTLRSMMWSAVAALVAYAWVWVTQAVAERTGFVESPPAAPHQGARPTQSSQRIPASTRMAVQMTLSLALAFVIGRTVFDPHWTWIVLTAFIVNSGNRGRGDVVHKCLLRIAGAGFGTIVATLISGLLPAHDNTAVVIILVTVVVGGWLRTISYAYWAGCVTSVLSLLQGYFGEGNVGLIGERLLQIVIGGALAVLVAWFVLPVKSSHVLGRRVRGCMAALGDARKAAQDAPAEFALHHQRFAENLAQLELVAPSFIAHRRLYRLRRRDGRHPADAVDALRACAAPMAVVAARESEQAVAAALREIGQSMRLVGEVYGTARDHAGKTPAQPQKA
jgi:uncharacterized membrane protein YccC